ncbi:MFS transporter [Lonsdalea britannica]|uniref:MFS transporter n=2 Tax=Lonsdalea britannica TaxID=1082704 RepID=A0AAD0SGL8_9GAMM|nr:MFS transporter [Lonsdalea britannica]AXW87522.1 MFS transporter [Lonsdalea britannica]OSN05383.1 MFS transporter [Lonsdalea britannica]
MELAQKSRWAIAVLFFVNGFVQGGWAVQITQLVPRFGVDDKTIGHLILIFGLGALLLMPLSGILMAKIGSQRVVQLFSIATSVALIPLGLVKNIPSLVVALFTLGAMIGSMNVAMNANAVAVEKKLSKAILSFSHCSWSIGLFVSGSIGGYSVKHFGYLGHILLMSVAAILLVSMTLPFVMKDKPEPKENIKQPMRLPRSAKIYFIGVMALFGMIPECAVVDWSSRYLIKDLRADIEIASLAFALFACGMSVLRLIGDHIRDRYGAVWIIRASSILAAVGVLIAALAITPWMAIFGFALAGIGIANIVPIAFSAAGNQPGVLASTGMSIATTIGYLGTLMAPAPIGYLAEYIGFSAVYVLMALMLGSIFLMAPIVGRVGANKI